MKFFIFSSGRVKVRPRERFFVCGSPSRGRWRSEMTREQTESTGRRPSTQHKEVGPVTPVPHEAIAAPQCCFDFDPPIAPDLPSPPVFAGAGKKEARDGRRRTFRLGLHTCVSLPPSARAKTNSLPLLLSQPVILCDPPSPGGRRSRHAPQSFDSPLPLSSSAQSLPLLIGGPNEITPFLPSRGARIAICGRSDPFGSPIPPQTQPS